MKRKFNLEDSGVDKVKVEEYRTACFATKSAHFLIIEPCPENYCNFINNFSSNI